MTHLGTQISALADGRLTGAARERALCHVAACEPCAQELAATRAARQALAAAADVPPAPDLAPRLLALGAAGPCGTLRRPATEPDHTRVGTPRSAGRVASVPALGGGPVLDGMFDAPVLDGSMTGWRRPSVRSVAVLSVGAAVVGLFLLGEARDVTPDSHPAEDLALLAAAGSGGGGLSVAPAGGAVAVGPADIDPAVLDAVWPGAGIPDGFTAVAADTDGGLARVGLDGPAGSVVVLRQQGHLRAGVVADVPTATIGEHEVHVLSVQPWHVVWQSGDAVVGVVAAHRSAAVDDVVAAYPAEDGDDGLGARVQRGWQVLVGAWSP